MKKMLYTMALTVTAFTASYAQKAERNKLTTEESVKKQVEAMKVKVNLTNDQVKKIEKLELERAKKFEELRKNDAADRKNRMEKSAAERKAYKEKIDAILTPEQQKALNQSKEEMRSKMKERSRNGRDHRRHIEKGAKKVEETKP